MPESQREVQCRPPLAMILKGGRGMNVMGLLWPKTCLPILSVRRIADKLFEPFA